MLTRLQSNLLFGLFYATSAASVLFELYLGYAMVEHGVTLDKGVAAVLNAGLLAGCGAIFIRMIKALFVDKEILPFQRLHRLTSARTAVIRAAQRSPEDAYETRRALINGTLQFGEETLQGWVPGSHFELCVFVDPEQPLLFGYFDSKHETSARSMRERIRNPAFYVERGYEVTKLLRDPTSQPRIIGDTGRPNIDYVFTTPQQRVQIRSTLLLCLDLDEPCALVISSNETNALADPDKKLMGFIRFVGEMVRYDLLQGGFLRGIRHMRPDLFPDQGRVLEDRRDTDLVGPATPGIEGREPATLPPSRNVDV